MRQPISLESEFLNVNLYYYPEHRNPHLGQTVTVGDMHGNSMKLLWILCYFGVLEIQTPKLNWGRLWQIYKTPVSHLTAELLVEFKMILAEAEIGTLCPSQIIFIGDLLADRGQNDYFTLMIFEKIHGVIPYKILLSNHDLYVIVYFEDKSMLHQVMYVGGSEHKQSFLNFLKLSKKFPELEEEVKLLLIKNYYPHLTLFTYEKRNQEQYVLFSHAVFNLEHLKPLISPGESFEKEYNNIDKFFHLINTINMKIIQWIYEFRLYSKDNLISKMIWERVRHDETFDYLRGLGILNVHGHIAKSVVEPDRVSLDTFLGRSHTVADGEYIPERMEGPLGIFSNPYCHLKSAPFPIDLLAKLFAEEEISSDLEEEAKTGEPDELISLLDAHLSISDQSTSTPNPHRFFQTGSPNDADDEVEAEDDMAKRQKVT